MLSRRTACHRLVQRGYDRLDLPFLLPNHKTQRVTIKLTRAIHFVLGGSLSVENAIASLQSLFSYIRPGYIHSGYNRDHGGTTEPERSRNEK